MNLDKKSLPAYLRRKKIVRKNEPVYSIDSFGNGLKNVMYRVQTAEQRLIVKQAHSRVQIKERWWVDRKRLFQEKSCVEILSQILPPDVIPEVLLEDRTNFILVSTAPSKDAVLWEQELSTGRIDLQIASQCGELLATVHNQTANMRDLKTMFKETKAFEQLRIEPLYERIARAHPDLKKAIDQQSKQLLKTKRALVLGDLRPRNVWLIRGQVYLVDFAACHFGSPSFDLAFYASDLCLKAILNSPQKAAYLEGINVFWASYFRIAEYARRQAEEKNAVRDFGCLLLSSIDGRLPSSPVDEETQDLTRRIAHSLFFTELEKIEDITEFINRTLIDG